MNIFKSQGIIGEYNLIRIESPQQCNDVNKTCFPFTDEETEVRKLKCFLAG